MSKSNEFIVENGVLKKYTGPGGDVVIPEGITGIARYSFENHRRLKTVTIPDSVAYVGNDAFRGCLNLSSVKLSTGLSIISERMFLDCIALENITIPDGVTAIGWAAFAGCSNLKHIQIPESLRQISGCAFHVCSSLEDMTIPEGVAKIEERAFAECTKLCRMNLPDSVTQIGSQAFENCPKLRFLRLPRNIAYDQITYGKLNVVAAYVLGQLDAGEATLSKVRQLIKNHKEKLMDQIVDLDSEEAFARFCEGWKKIKLEQLDEYLELAIKAGATNVTAALLEYKQRHYSTEIQEKIQMDRMDRELGFKEPTVSDWRKIFKFVLKDGVAILTDYKGTDPVVVIPEKIGKNPVEVIEWEGFECCDVIREVTIPGSMKEIRFMAFCRCHNLEVVRFLPGVKTTGDNSFWLCSNLKHVYLPASVVEIRSFYQNQYTIHAPAGSYAEIYAKENGIPFVAE